MTALGGSAPRTATPSTLAGVRNHLAHQLRRSAVVRSLFVTGVVQPVFFLVIMGLGVGTFVDANPGADLGSDYLTFIGPGLLATAAMQYGAGEGLWPTKGAILWEGAYRTALHTPLSLDQLIAGHILWIGGRIVVAATLFVAVLAVFGIPASWWVLLAPLAAGLVAAAFGAPLSAFAAWVDNDHFFPLIMRLGVIPMFIFSGAFFPFDNLPVGVAWLARLTPAWHGVELCRDLSLGTLGWNDLGHLGYLIALTAGGWLWCRRSFRTALAA